MFISCSRGTVILAAHLPAVGPGSGRAVDMYIGSEHECRPLSLRTILESEIIDFC